MFIVIHADGTEETSEVDEDDDVRLSGSEQELLLWVEPRLEPVSGD
jgi:hypothetical protein